MPPARKVCVKSGCPELAERGEARCEIHRIIRPHGWSSSSRRKPGNWAGLTKKIYRRDDGSCRKCGHPGTVVDHLLPMKWGGGHDLMNLRVMCDRCHTDKTNEESQLGRRMRGVTSRERDVLVREFVARWRA